MDGNNDPKGNPEEKKIQEKFFTSLNETDMNAAKAEKINNKVKLILQIVADCDSLVSKG